MLVGSYFYTDISYLLDFNTDNKVLFDIKYFFLRKSFIHIHLYYRYKKNDFWFVNDTPEIIRSQILFFKGFNGYKQILYFLGMFDLVCVSNNVHEVGMVTPVLLFFFAK